MRWYAGRMPSKRGLLFATALLLAACGQEDDMVDPDGGWVTPGSNPAVAGDAAPPSATPAADAGAAASGGTDSGARPPSSMTPDTGVVTPPSGRDAMVSTPEGGSPRDSGAADAGPPMPPGDGGGGAAGGYCPSNGDPCKILPLGDSITDGIGFSGGYRVQLFRLATMNMKKITYVGSKMNGPQMVDNMLFPRRHEGTSGITIGGLDGRIPMPGLNEIPHIVLLHIGTNDMYMSPAGAPDRLGTLIDGIVTAAPDALIVVSKIIPFSSGSSAVMTYNNAIPAVVQKRIDAGKHIMLIDQFTGFPTSELGDGVHPNQAGYSRMAGKWYEAISMYLK